MADGNSDQKSDEHPINRPPKPPGLTLGPYYQFLTTDLEKMQWLGSVLIFQHVSFDQPKIEFTSETKIDYDWEILYENVFNMRAYRINLTIALPPGEGDEKILWQIDWDEFSSNGSFYIARYDQKWRGGFFSCNGYDATTPKEQALVSNYDNVWNHLHSIHEKSPLHILLWGGDQSYNDFVIEDVSYLQDWSKLPFNDEKWTYPFTAEAMEDVERYYFYTYAEHWERRPEMKRALGSIPSMMMWDDHDIFDGAGSYPPELQQSPIMAGLFEAAQKMRLLFQHHTTSEKARAHRLFGFQGHNYLARCGPDLLILGADGRTERTVETVHHENTWDIIFEKLDSELGQVKHLIVLFPIPFSFVRIKVAESLLERWKNLTSSTRNVALLSTQNSVFGLPEIYDDLLDEWVHESHMGERNHVLQRFQKLSEEKKVRITFFSGDVHCCGVSRFRTHTPQLPMPLHDRKLMYQIISSAIVNKPPPRIVIRAVHFAASKWYPVKDTEEEVINLFDKMPEDGSSLIFQKLLPNRNWCYFEQNTETKSLNDPTVQTGIFQAIRSNILSSLSSFGWNQPSNWWGTQEQTKKTTNESSLEIDQEQRKMNNLKIRFWLESIPHNKEQHHQRFAGYDLYIPHLD